MTNVANAIAFPQRLAPLELAAFCQCMRFKIRFALLQGVSYNNACDLGIITGNQPGYENQVLHVEQYLQ